MPAEIVPMGEFMVHIAKDETIEKIVDAKGKEYAIEKVEIFTKREYGLSNKKHFHYLLQCKTLEGYFFDGENNTLKSIGFMHGNPVTFH